MYNFFIYMYNRLVIGVSIVLKFFGLCIFIYGVSIYMYGCMCKFVSDYVYVCE